MSYIEIPKGYTVLRIKKDDRLFDVAVPNEIVDRVVEEFGAELLTDEGWDMASEAPTLSEVINDKPLMIGDVSIRELLAKAVQVPHLRKLEYADRAPLDLGPVPRPAHTHWGTKIHRADPNRKQKRKAQKAARRRNR
jgi:hypothetical protein